MQFLRTSSYRLNFLFFSYTVGSDVILKPPLAELWDLKYDTSAYIDDKWYCCHRENGDNIWFNVWCFYYSHIELNKQHGLKRTKGNYEGCEGCIKIAKKSLSELTWWMENLPNVYRKINQERSTVTLCSDASNLV